MGIRSGKNYGKLALVRGGVYAQRQPKRVEMSGPEFLKLDVDVHTAFNAMVAANGARPSRGVQEIAEHRQRPWRVLARRFREARDAGVPLHQVIAVVRALEGWTRCIYMQDERGGWAA